MTETKDDMCWHNRFHPTMPACTNAAVWQSDGLGNIMDASKWCAEHAPSPRFRTRIIARESSHG